MHQSITKTEQLSAETGQALVQPNKAGILLYGWDNNDDKGGAKGSSGHRQLHVLAPFSEGRFEPRTKAYTLAKGKIDEGETPIAAAMRETKEETGLSIEALLGETAAAQFKNGQVIENHASPTYQGVVVKRADPAPIRHAYISSHGVTHHAVYYAIEVEGIKKLAPHLKHVPSRSDRFGHRVRSTAMHRATQQGLPKFQDLLQTMRTGKINVCGKAESDVVIPSPVLPDLEQKYQNLPITDLESMERFFENIGREDGALLNKDLESLKCFMEKQGLVSDGQGKLKFDIRDKPLNYFQEGAEILPASEVLRRSAMLADQNALYAAAMWGNYEGSRYQFENDLAHVKESQIAVLVELVSRHSPMELAMFTSADVNVVGNKPPHRAVVKKDAWLSKNLHVARSFAAFLGGSEAGWAVRNKANAAGSTAGALQR